MGIARPPTPRSIAVKRTAATMACHRFGDETSHCLKHVAGCSGVQVEAGHSPPQGDSRHAELARRLLATPLVVLQRGHDALALVVLRHWATRGMEQALVDRRMGGVDQRALD